MPGRDGIAATQAIRAQSRSGASEGRRTPIIALTANASDEDRDACLAAGIDGFLTKPLDRERLSAALAADATRWRRKIFRSAQALTRTRQGGRQRFHART